MSTLRHPLFVLVLLCLFLGGCASKYGTQSTVVNYYPQCYEPIESLRQAESNFQTTIAASTLIGIALGAAVGVALTGSVEGAISGAAAGAAAGATLGYVAAKREEYKDSLVRMASYLQDLEGDITNLDEVSAAGRVAIQCYDKQFQDALVAYNAKTISRAEFDARYAEILSGTQEADRIMRLALKSATERNNGYQDALYYEKRLYGRKDDQPKGVVTKTKPKKVIVEQSTPAQDIPAKVTPVAKPAPVDPEIVSLEENREILVSFEEKARKYRNSHQDLVDTQATVKSKLAAWAVDLSQLQS